MTNAETTEQDKDEAAAKASARLRGRALRAALAAEAGYILSVRAA